jgi:hypothetical protein
VQHTRRKLESRSRLKERNKSVAECAKRFIFLVHLNQTSAGKSILVFFRSISKNPGCYFVFVQIGFIPLRDFNVIISSEFNLLQAMQKTKQEE